MASDKLMNHTQGETIITKLTAIADSLDDLAAVTPAKLGMGIATCDTPASTAAKTAALANFALVEGAPVSVQFTYANTASNATLNINNTGAKPIIYKDAAIGNDVISAGDTCTFIYTTNSYRIINIDTLTGAGTGTVTQVGAENGLITDQNGNADIHHDGKIGLNLKSITAFSSEVSAHNTSTDKMYPVALDSEGHPVAAVSNFVGSGSNHKAGLVPDTPSTAGTTKYLREDATWVEPTGDDLKLTGYEIESQAAAVAATDTINEGIGKLEYKVDANSADIQSILDGTTIDSFSDVETALSGKQATLSTTQLAAVNSGIDTTKVGQIATNTSDISSLQDAVDTKLDKTANAVSAAKLNNGTTDYAVGSATKGVYFNNGVPTAMTYSVNSNVPENAVFTDTTYSSGSGITVNSSHQINHSNSVTAKTTASALKVAYDAQGHITGSSALTASDVGAIATTAKGVANGVAELDSTGKVPSSQLPSYVDDVLEYSAKSSFPATGETGKIYVDTSDNKTYRWGGSAYVEISESLALGDTSSTAYYGNKGKTAYDHATDSSRLTTAQSSGLYKIATTAQGHIASVTAVAKSDITDLGIPGSDTNTHRPIQVNGTQVLGDNTTALNLKAGSNVSLSNSSGTVTIAATDTTYSSKSAASGGTDVSLCTTGEKYTWNSKGTYSKPSGGIPKSDLASAVQTSLGKADSALQSETDPTVPSWAKQSNKPSYTQDEVADGSTYKRVTQTEKDAWSGKGTYSKPSGGIPKSDLASAVQTSLGKADTALQSFTETDPTVPSWAKQSSKPSYTYSEVGAAPASHSHYQLSTLGDYRTLATKPDDYPNIAQFKGLKQNSVIGNPSSDTYSYIVGLRGWSDNSGGNAHEFAFNDTGIFTRRGASTSWGSWAKLAMTSDIPSSLPASDVYSWAKQSTKPSYTQDEVSDGSTYKRVSATEKNTWNNKGTYSKPSTGIPKTDLASAVQTSIGKADTALQSFTETDPTVPAWAKASSKPSYTQDEVSDGSTYKRVSATEKSTWNSKGTYSKPSGGIPKSDLASAVQTSLGKADSALQSSTDIAAALGYTPANNDGVNQALNVRVRCDQYSGTNGTSQTFRVYKTAERGVVLVICGSQGGTNKQSTILVFDIQQGILSVRRIAMGGNSEIVDGVTVNYGSEYDDAVITYTATNSAWPPVIIPLMPNDKTPQMAIF
jgi:outer membrane murein-binding lipoprotein Lpp